MMNDYVGAAKALLGANSIYIYPHVNSDGDCLGSSVAMCRALRMFGKTAHILLEDDVPQNIKFLMKDYCIMIPEWESLPTSDISLAIDCGDDSRFPERAAKFATGKLKVCLDHHRTTTARHDINIIDSMASSAGVHVFRTLKEMDKLQPGSGIIGDHEIGIAIYTSITTDTGNFQYSNTDAECHAIMSEIYSWGTKTYPASVEIYESESLARVKLAAMAMNNLKISDDGLIAISYLTKEMCDSVDAKSGDTDGIVNHIRAILGVEYAALIKEHTDGVCRISLRAKTRGDVAATAFNYGGGGHGKASGFSIRIGVDEAIKLVEKELVKLAKEQLK